MTTAREHVEHLLENTVEKFDGCRIWQGAVDDRGYGYAKIGGKKILVHKYVFLYYRDRPDAAVAILKRRQIGQTCGHPVCIEPSHLQQASTDKVYVPLVEWWKQS
jgi:hypothetical protein